MPIHLRCGNRMDGSGPTLISSSPNCELAELISQISSRHTPRDERAALPRGHPLTWGALTFNTLLEGSIYADSV
jgi:hypothetical protein